MLAGNSRWWVMLSGIALLIVFGSGAAVARANQSAPRSQPPGTAVTDDQKRRLLATVDARWEAEKRRPKGTPVLMPTMTSTCPLEPETGIFPFKHFPEQSSLFGILYVSGNALTSRAVALASTGQVFAVYAGATDKDAEQGLMIVVAFTRDPCADPLGKGSYVHHAQTPQRQGAAKLVALEGDTVVFTTARGVVERFDYVTEQFLGPVAGPGTPSATPRASPVGTATGR